VTLVPLVSWITPANVVEGGLLLPSLRWCRRHLGWWPGIVVADMGYLSAPGKQAARESLQTAVVTKLRADMKLVSPYASATTVECPQGQRLEWWEYEPESGQQWFRVPAQPELCVHCWQAAHCPGHFGYAADAHETLLGLLPLASRVAQRLLRQARPWIEPAQSFEKNQLGLGQMFFNSLRLTWQCCYARWLGWICPRKHTCSQDFTLARWNWAWPSKRWADENKRDSPAISHFSKTTFGTPSYEGSGVKGCFDMKAGGWDLDARSAADAERSRAR
jgi:hypothetical protein